MTFRWRASDWGQERSARCGPALDAVPGLLTSSGPVVANPCNTSCPGALQSSATSASSAQASGQRLHLFGNNSREQVEASQHPLGAETNELKRPISRRPRGRVTARCATHVPPAVKSGNCGKAFGLKGAGQFEHRSWGRTVLHLSDAVDDSLPPWFCLPGGMRNARRPHQAVHPRISAFVRLRNLVILGQNHLHQPDEAPRFPLGTFRPIPDRVPAPSARLGSTWIMWRIRAM